MSKFDAAWNDSFAELSGYSFKLVSESFDILYAFYMNVYQKIKEKDEIKNFAIESKQKPEKVFSVVQSTQNTARGVCNNALVPSLNLDNINDTNFNYLGNETAHNASKNVNITGVYADSSLPGIDSNPKRFELPAKLKDKHILPFKLKPLSLKNKEKLKHLKFNQIKFANKRKLELPKMSFNLNNLTSHNRSECPSFRNLKENNKANQSSAFKCITRSQSVKEHMIFQSKRLYNTDLGNTENTR